MIWLMKLFLMATQHFRSGHHQNSVSPSNIQLGKMIKSLSKMIVIITLYLPKSGGLCHLFSLIFFQFSSLILWFLIFSVVESNTKTDLCRSLLFSRPNSAPALDIWTTANWSMGSGPRCCWVHLNQVFKMSCSFKRKIIYRSFCPLFSHLNYWWIKGDL